MFPLLPGQNTELDKGGDVGASRSIQHPPQSASCDPHSSECLLDSAARLASVLVSQIEIRATWIHASRYQVAPQSAVGRYHSPALRRNQCEFLSKAETRQMRWRLNRMCGDDPMPTRARAFRPETDIGVQQYQKYHRRAPIFKCGSRVYPYIADSFYPAQ